MPIKSSLPHREKSVKTTKLNTNLGLRSQAATASSKRGKMCKLTGKVGCKCHEKK